MNRNGKKWMLLAKTNCCTVILNLSWFCLGKEKSELQYISYIKKKKKKHNKEFTAKYFEFTRDPSLPFLKIMWGETGVCSGQSGFPNRNQRLALIHRGSVLSQSLKVMSLSSKSESSQLVGILWKKEAFFIKFKIAIINYSLPPILCKFVYDEIFGFRVKGPWRA